MRSTARNAHARFGRMPQFQNLFCASYGKFVIFFYMQFFALCYDASMFSYPALHTQALSSALLAADSLFDGHVYCKLSKQKLFGGQLAQFAKEDR